MRYTNIILTIIFILLSIQNVSALSFSNFSTGGVGFVSNGNGYFDDTESAFNYTGNRNVYIVAETTEIWIFEPISRSAGVGAAYTLINSSVGAITNAVVRNGYLYFIDNNVLKKRLTRNIGTVCESTDTTAGGCISIIVSSGVGAIYANGDTLYYTQGTALKHLDADDITVSDFNLQTIPGAQSQYSAIAVLSNSTSGFTEAYITAYSGVQVFLYRCRSTGCTAMGSAVSNNGVEDSSFFTTTNYLYALQFVSTGSSAERLYLISNGSLSSIDYITDNTITRPGRVFVGGQSTIGLAAQTTTAYETFNAIEAGQDNLPSTPSELTYQTKTISSVYTTYYNRSDIFLQYRVTVNALDTANLLLDTDDYRWMITMTDPNSVQKDVTLSSKCEYPSALNFTCTVGETLDFAWPAPGWLIGTWGAKLYEVNIVTGDRALIATATSFTVLNTTVDNQSIITPPTEDITTGTAPQAISLIDGFVLWLGMGINAVSKLLFAMIFIAIAATVGLIWGNGNIAMVFAFVPYAFFTFIDYIPKWIFIITIILIAIASRAFR